MGGSVFSPCPGGDLWWMRQWPIRSRGCQLTPFAGSLPQPFAPAAASGERRAHSKQDLVSQAAITGTGQRMRHRFDRDHPVRLRLLTLREPRCGYSEENEWRHAGGSAPHGDWLCTRLSFSAFQKIRIGMRTYRYCGSLAMRSRAGVVSLASSITTCSAGSTAVQKSRRYRPLKPTVRPGP
jgi:hypothetical protein